MTDFEHISIDLTDALGNVLLRSGIALVYFLDSAHAEHAPAVAAAMGEFAARFMARAPVFYPVDDAFKEVRADEVAALLDEHVLRPSEPPKFALTDSLQHAPCFSSSYCGMDRERLAEINWPNATCGLRFTFSLEAMDDSCLADICEFAFRWARALPLASGYVAPAFVVREGIDEDIAMRSVVRLCRRYRCMDISALLVDCFEVGAGVKGAYWCNFLGPQALAQLGGEARLRTLFAGTDTLLETLGDDRLMIVLGPLPVFGDVNRRQDLALYRFAFGLFEPALRPRTVPYLSFDEESMQAWVHRFGREGV